jgi:hypothetical protein
MKSAIIFRAVATAAVSTLAATVTMSGCTSSGAYLRSDAPAVGLELTATDLDAHVVTVEASSSWMFDPAAISVPEGETPWLSVRYADDNPSLLWVKALSRNESPTPRIDTILMASGDGLALEIPVRQLALDVTFGVEPRTLQPFGPYETAVRTLTVTSTLEWEAFTLGESEWLTIARGTGSGHDGTITVGVTPTRSLDPRRDTIVVRVANPAFHDRHADSIAVVQQGTDLLVESDAIDLDTFEIGVPAAGGEIALTVYSREAWSVAADAGATAAGIVTFDPATGPADLQGITVVMTVAPNAAAEERTFTLTLDSAGQQYEYICRQMGDRSPPGDPEEEEGT